MGCIRAAHVQNLILFVAGRKGSGKTTLALQVAHDAPRVFVLDTIGQYGPEHGYVVAFGLDECVRAMLDARERERFKVSLRSGSVDDMLDLMRLAYEIPHHLLVVEEVSFYCSPNRLPDELSTLIRYGRHRAIDQLYIARRPFEVHRDVTAQADVGVSFVQHEPNDVAYLRAVAGPGAVAVMRLPQYRAMLWGEVERAPLAAIEAADVILDRRGGEPPSLEPVTVEPAGLEPGGDAPAPGGARS